MPSQTQQSSFEKSLIKEEKKGLPPRLVLKTETFNAASKNQRVHEIVDSNSALYYLNFSPRLLGYFPDRHFCTEEEHKVQAV